MKRSALLLLVVTVLMLCLCGCSGNSEFSSVKEADSWTVEVYPLCTQLEEQFALKSGGRIAVDPNISSGSMKIKIAKQNEAPIYEGNAETAAYFEVTVGEDGAYTVSLDGKNAEGSISFRIKTEEIK